MIKDGYANLSLDMNELYEITLPFEQKEVE